MEQHFGAGHVAARVGIGVVAAEVLHVAEDVTLPVLRHGHAHVAAEPEIGDRRRLAVEAVDREVLHHHHAAAVEQLAPDVGHHLGERGEREVVAPHRLDRDALRRTAATASREFVMVARGEPVAPGRDRPEIARRPRGRIDHRLHGDGGHAPCLMEGAEVAGHCGIHLGVIAAGRCRSRRVDQCTSFCRSQRCNSGRPRMMRHAYCNARHAI